ncbi:MAG: KH domain-containing protein [Spiroplasma sp.]
MYIKIVEQLIEPILLQDIDQIEIREIASKENEFEVIILAPKIFFKKLIGKNGNIIQALSTLVNLKAEMNNQKVKIIVSEL